MTEAAAAARAEPLQHLEVWAGSLSQVLGQISGSPVPVAVFAEAPADLPSEAEDDLWLLCAYSGNLRGEMCWRVPRTSVLGLAQTLMGESAAAGAEAAAEQRDAAVELLRQVAGVAATALQPGWGEVVLRLDAAPGPPSWPAAITAWLRAGEETSRGRLLEARLSAALVAGLRAEKSEAAKPAAAPTFPAAPAPASAEVKLDLLMDVELAVALRFGSRTLALREILDLSPGAVIDLDRQVEEPVDLLLDGRLLARGEVVVLEGNYALRVTEVAPANLYGKP